MSVSTFINSWEGVKVSTTTGVWEKLIPTLMDDLQMW